MRAVATLRSGRPVRGDATVLDSGVVRVEHEEPVPMDGDRLCYRQYFAPHEWSRVDELERPRCLGNGQRIHSEAPSAMLAFGEPAGAVTW